jgi:uncharacterized membrane protein
MEAYVLDWLNLLARWLHLIAGVAWIGASFYFVMLDNSLSPPTRPEDAKRGVFGELWAVHGGGFYVSQKFLTGPQGEPLSGNLHWSKWEAYTTWLSGIALLALIYWLGASSYLIDRNVVALSPLTAIAISVAFIVGGWLVYDGLCRVLEGRENILAALIFAFVMFCTWALYHLFSARAAYVHVGAMIGTMMVANVFFHIIPGQKKMVADIRAGRPPDPRPGIVGKQRSVHNTYFTLPVLFVMISNHYPMTYSHPYGWLVLGAIMLAGVDSSVFRAAASRPRAMGAARRRCCAARRPRCRDRAETCGLERRQSIVRQGERRAECALSPLPCGAADATGICAAAERYRVRYGGPDCG